MRIWWMQASSRLDNPGLPSLSEGAAGVKAAGGGAVIRPEAWGPVSGGTLSGQGSFPSR